MRSVKNEANKPLKAKSGTDGSKPNRSVGDALRQAYDDAVRETVPDDLLALLKQLD